MRTRGWEGNKPRRHTDRKAGGKGPGGPLYRLATLVKADARTCIRSVYEIALHQIHVQCSGEVQIFFRFDTLENHGKAKLVGHFNDVPEHGSRCSVAAPMRPEELPADFEEV